MTETPFRIESIPWRRVMPWLHLTRCFWIALNVRKLVLAALGILLIAAGFSAIDRLPFARSIAGQPAASDHWPWNWSLGYALPGGPSALGTIARAPDDPFRTIVTVAGNWHIVLHPLLAVFAPAQRLFAREASWAALADAVTRLLWALAVWTLFAGAITRMAAVRFARDQQVSIWGALRFSLQRFLGFFTAPLLPFAGIGALLLLCVIGGWLGRIPEGVGETVLGILWGLELLFGLMMAVVLVGLAVGWPLTFATIGVEGTDGFDGLSRMYNYVFERPLYYVWQVLVTLVMGSVAIFFVWFMVQSLVHLAIWGVSWGMGDARLAQMLPPVPPAISPNEGFVAPGDDLVQKATGMAADEAPASQDAAESPAPPGLGTRLASFWMGALALLVIGYVYSYFWTSVTVIYFVLRRSVDANDFDEVFMEDEQEPDNLLPLVGAAAMGETERLQPAGAPPGPAPPVDLAP